MTKGLGAGSHPDVGRAAADEVRDHLAGRIWCSWLRGWARTQAYPLRRSARQRSCAAQLRTKTRVAELALTPKHGSWLNIIEGFFSKLTRSVLRHIRVASKQELLLPRLGDRDLNWR